MQSECQYLIIFPLWVDASVPPSPHLLPLLCVLALHSRHPKTPLVKPWNKWKSTSMLKLLIVISSPYSPSPYFLPFGVALPSAIRSALAQFREEDYSCKSCSKLFYSPHPAQYLCHPHAATI